MRVALFGGSGFMGRELIRLLGERGHVPVVFGRGSQAPDSGAFEYYPVDYERDVAPDGLEGADAVVVLAARRPYAGFSFSDYEGNVATARRCFEFSLDSGVSNIVFASSKAVYSDQESMPWDEGLCPSPAGLYGASKAAAEQIAGVCNSQRGAAIKCLRFAQVIGVGEREGFLINTLIDNAVAGRRQVVYGDGSQRRQYVYVKDACAAMLAALEHPDAAGAFNIGMRGFVSNLAFAECVNEVFGNEGNLVCDPSREMRGSCDEMDVCKAERVLGFWARFGLREALEDIRADELEGSDAAF